MDTSNLTAEALKHVLHFDPDTGLFVWKQRMGKRGIPGRVAGTVDFGGYVAISINRKRHKAHRLAWLYMTGSWPEVAIDHINGIREDNRFANLRQADWGQNQQNRKLQRNNKSGFLGVSWDSLSGKWRAGIRVAGKSTNLGGYETAVRAHMAYLEAKAKMHPFQPVPRNA